jgi:hypothetical protein
MVDGFMSEPFETSEVHAARVAQTGRDVRSPAEGGGGRPPGRLPDTAKGSRPTWEIVVTVAGAMAGLGLMVIVLGAGVVWIRLDAVGLPAVVGLSVTPNSMLAVLGARYLVEPMVISFLSIAAMNYYLDHQSRETARAEAAGKERPVFLEHKIWSALKRSGNRAWSMRGVRWMLYLLLVPLLPLILINVLFERLRVPWLWWIVIVPFSWFWVSTVLCFAVAWRWSNHVWRTGIRERWPLRSIRRRTAAAFLAMALITALAGQADHPTQIPPASVMLISGHTEKGLYVADDGQAVYLGKTGRIAEIPRRAVQRVVVGHPKEAASRPSLLMRLFNAVF